VVSLQQRVNNGQKLNRKEIATGQSIECTVSEASDLRDGSQQVSLAFNKPYPRFWHVAFPPGDCLPTQHSSISDGRKSSLDMTPEGDDPRASAEIAHRDRT
jgi:hypothetical protein